MGGVMRYNPNLLENTRHGTAIFPFEYYRCTIPENFAALPVHWHSELEFTYVLEGSCTYQIDLLPRRISKGDFLLIPPGILHGFSAENCSHMITDSFVFRMDMLEAVRNDACTSYLLPIAQQTVRFPVVLDAASPYNEKIRSIFYSLLETVTEKPERYELETKALLFHLFFTLYQYVPYQKQNMEHEEITGKLKKVLQYMQDNYQKAITIPELASLCGFSEYHFMRFFKKHMNLTCIEYLNQYRLNMAARQLTATDLPVTTIALESGFNNISYFNRVFKKYFCITPREFRTPDPKDSSYT